MHAVDVPKLILMGNFSKFLANYVARRTSQDATCTHTPQALAKNSPAYCITFSFFYSRFPLFPAEILNQRDNISFLLLPTLLPDIIQNIPERIRAHY